MPLGTTARQSPSGSLKFLTYYQGAAEQPVNFTVGGGACASANGVAFACGQNGDIEATGSGHAAMFKLGVQLGDYVQPYAVLGTGSYELSVPSVTVANRLTGNASGLLYGGGVKFSVVPETQFDTAIALDLGLTRSAYSLDHVSPGGFPGAGPLDERLTLTTWQVAVEASHRFSLKSSKLEPYGGVKWTRVESDLKDVPSGGHAGGRKDAGSPFLGLRWQPAERVAGFVESSFVDGYHYGAGLEFRFR
jgi:opacity protein-like surface antigen